MSAAKPSAARMAALRVYKLLPTRVSHGIVHVLTSTYTAGAVAIIEHDGHILALRQAHRTGWSLPGGLIEKGEQPAEAVAREVFEETGLRINPGGVMATAIAADIKHIDIIFRVHCEARPVVTPSSEALAADWFKVDELPEGDESTERILNAVKLARSTPEPGFLLD